MPILRDLLAGLVYYETTALRILAFAFLIMLALVTSALES